MCVGTHRRRVPTHMVSRSPLSRPFRPPGSPHRQGCGAPDRDGGAERPAGGGTAPGAHGCNTAAMASGPGTSVRGRVPGRRTEKALMKEDAARTAPSTNSSRDLHRRRTSPASRRARWPVNEGCLVQEFQRLSVEKASQPWWSALGFPPLWPPGARRRKSGKSHDLPAAGESGSNSGVAEVSECVV